MHYTLTIQYGCSPTCMLPPLPVSKLNSVYACVSDFGRASSSASLSSSSPTYES